MCIEQNTLSFVYYWALQVGLRLTSHNTKTLKTQWQIKTWLAFVYVSPFVFPPLHNWALLLGSIMFLFILKKILAHAGF